MNPRPALRSAALLGCILAALWLAPARSAASSLPSAVPSTPPSTPSAHPASRPNLLLNGDFTTGSGNAPDDWRTSAWKEGPQATSYDWLHGAGSEPELAIDSTQTNDARWLQSLSLGAGWYRLSVEARSEKVGTGATGVTISVTEDSISSRDLRGTTDWQNLELYLKIGRHGADIDVALRLGGYSSLAYGRAFFRHARLERISAPPVGAGPLFNLDAIRAASAPQPVGRRWTLFAAFALLAAVAVAGWRLCGPAI